MTWQQKYERVPFVEKGRCMAGSDCWGLVRLILKAERGIDLPDYLDIYSLGFKEWSDSDRENLQAIIKEESQQNWQEVAKPQAFDVVVMKLKGFATHVGIAIDGRRMIHCQRGVGTSIERMNSIIWRDNIVGFYRWSQPKI